MIYRQFVLLILLVVSVCPAFSQQACQVSFVRPGQSHHTIAYFADVVDIVPEFPGGETALRQFINSERHYPRDAYEMGIQGRVVCGFIVDSDGSLHNVTVHRGPCESLGAEAVRIIESMPRWEAGLLNGIRVPVYYVLTIPFRL